MKFEEKKGGDVIYLWKSIRESEPLGEAWPVTSGPCVQAVCVSPAPGKFSDFPESAGLKMENGE